MRMEIENVFGIIVARFPVTKLLPFKGKNWREDDAAVITACMILHNFCIDARDPPLDYRPPAPRLPRVRREDEQPSSGVIAHDLRREALTRYLYERFELVDGEVQARRFW